MYETITACNPDDPSECIDFECDENAHCCVEGAGCADCSEANPNNFNPEDCVEDELYR